MIEVGFPLRFLAHMRDTRDSPNNDLNYYYYEENYSQNYEKNYNYRTRDRTTKGRNESS